MPPPLNNYFLIILAKDYSHIKKMFAYKIKSIGMKYDEDIFSDTMLKCNDLIHEDTKETDALKYFWTAFRNNTLREVYYLRNRLVIELTDNVDLEDNEEYDKCIDYFFDLCINTVKENFGEEVTRLWLLHSNGMTYKQLCEVTAITNLRYRFRRIREFLWKTMVKGYMVYSQ